MSMYSIPQQSHSGSGRRDPVKCAIGCQEWAATSRRHLCTHPIIKGPRSAQAFLAYLQQSPEVRPGNLVEGLWLRAQNSNRGTKDPWMKNLIIALTGRLPNLRSITLQNWGPVVICSNLTAALRSFTQITTLDLQAPVFSSSADLEHVVFALHGLSSLRLDYVSWKPDPDTNALPLNTAIYQLWPLPLSKVELYSMHSDTVGPLFRWLGRHGCRPSELVVSRIYERHIAYLSNYMAFIGDRLEVFDFWPLFSYQGNPVQNVETLFAHNLKVWSLTLQTNGSRGGGHENSWVPEVLRSARRCPLQKITFAMCLEDERALQTPLWRTITDIIRQHLPRTLRSVAFVHKPIKDETRYCNNFLQDGTLAFRRCFAEQLESVGIHVEVRNAPVLDLNAYDLDD
ncbi:uncharacterized protein TRAVEDRAFT_43179 [Trametes versicolor FP-101664 SS1]|uniref:uncharacterized protein n=1 Tax=Trametes versicolor (strain FP-101664) TaxID=717944 RepID=UPI0004622FA8|nr:uncharacterized protein TRAVEDRAFT_43179 [Trametes versicolor FP-101664 SS1]EIW62858.1 hypothetical protein TRAVEDRAFT_43179 [Trametes versicolor FP-101664 SS1]